MITLKCLAKNFVPFVESWIPNETKANEESDGKSEIINKTTKVAQEVGGS